MEKRRANLGEEVGLNIVDDASPSGVISSADSQSALSPKPACQVDPFMSCFLLTIIGALLRFYHLNYNSLWLDEAATYSYSQKSILEIWSFTTGTSTTGGEFSPPLFFWIEHIMLLFGNNEFILRLIPAMLGALTIPLFYLIGKEVMDQNLGLIAAALLCASPFHLYYSQEARAYTSVLFFVSLALICYLRAYRSHELKYWTLFGICSALAFWTHYYSIIVTGTLGLFGLIVQARKARANLSELKPILIALATFVLLCLPLLIVAMRLLLIRTSAPPTFGIQGIRIVEESIRQIFGFNSTIALIFMILFILGIIQLFRVDATKSLMIITVVLVTSLASLALSYRMPMLPRYLIILLPFLYAGVGAAYRPLYARFSHRAVIYFFIIALLAPNISFYDEYYYNYLKDDWRGFALELQDATHDGDLVVVVPAYIRGPLDYYYSNTSDHTIEYGASTAEDLERLYSSRGTI
jgi:4-amino-4-deoxy-L-arabinose transferase-like glycosyltransferase